MRTFVKSAALFVALTSLVWIAVLWRWRATRSDFGAADIALYLCVLPVLVFALALGGRWAVRSALATQAASAATAGAVGTEPGRAEQQDAPAAVSWHLLAAWANTAAGASVDALMAAIDAGAPRPSPDAGLLDDDGLPVMAARIAELDTDSVDNALQRLAESAQVAQSLDASTEPPPRAVRALATLAPLIDELAQSLLMTAHQWDEAAASTSALPVGSMPAPPDDAKKVRVLAAWPLDWSDATCALATAWLAERLCDPLAAALPPPRWSVQAQRMSGAELLASGERTLGLLQRQGRDDPVVLMACHSDLDADGIRALEAEQRLFHATRRPKAAMAGEGAAVVLLSALAWPAEAAIEPVHVRLTNPAVARRSQSIEAAGRSASDATVEMVRLGLARAGLSGTAVGKLASDADQHTARATELFAVTLALLPELDVADDLRLAGTLVGRLEAAAPLLTLACAAVQARESGKPAIALSLGDPHWRMAAVLCPASFVPA